MVKDRYNTHCEMIALLCKPEKELSDAIPSANPMKTLQGSEVSRSRRGRKKKQTANQLVVAFSVQPAAAQPLAPSAQSHHFSLCSLTLHILLPGESK